MTLDEALAHAATVPERTPILVRQEGDELVARYGDRDYRSGNPFGLDSKLSDGGVPAPRNLYFIDEPKGDEQ